ncbi:MAG: hypothetical protein HQL40_00515 [Alphaproteobacteria bacterium]|nr:hypothetical protein [Alphaproteobacteria bacterium]
MTTLSLDVQPREVYEGEAVEVSWTSTKAKKVWVSRVGEWLAANGRTSINLEGTGKYLFEMAVIGEDNVKQVASTVEVEVKARKYLAPPRDFVATGTDSVVGICIPCKASLPVIPCCVWGMIVKCGHDERTFHLSPPCQAPTFDKKHLLEVVSHASRPDTVEVSLDAAKCNKGKSIKQDSSAIDYPCLYVHLPDGTTFNATAPHKMEVFPAKKDESREWPLRFFVEYLIPRQKPATYWYRALSCSDTECRARVDVYNDQGWSGSVSLDFKTEEVSEKSWFGSTKIETTCKASITGSISVIDGPTEIEISREFSKSFKKVEYFISKLVRLLQRYGKAEFDQTNIKFSGGARWVEDKTTYRAFPQGSIEIKLDPLFGATKTWDILDGILRVGHPLGVFLADLKKKLAEGSKVGKIEIAVNLILSGKISGEAAWDTDSNGVWKRRGGVKAVGKVGVSLEGLASGELTIFILKASGKFSATAESGITLTFEGAEIEGEPAVSFQGEFLGLKVVTVVAGEIGISVSKTTSESAALIESESSGTLKYEKEEEYDIMEPIKFPEEAKLIKFSSGDAL